MQVLSETRKTKVTKVGGRNFPGDPVAKTLCFQYRRSRLDPWPVRHMQPSKHVKNIVIFVVQSLSPIPLFATPQTAARQDSLSFTISRALLRFMSIVSVMLFNHFILCCLLLLWPSIFPSIRVFSSEPALHIRWPKYWIFSFSISPSNEYSELISFRIDSFDLLAVQGTHKNRRQQHSLKASVLQCLAFFMVQLLTSLWSNS